MKRFFLAVLPVLVIIAAVAPAKASGKEEGANKGACQSIPPPSTNGTGSLKRLQAMQRCDMEIRSREQHQR